jgi:hypothetical protein
MKSDGSVVGEHPSVIEFDNYLTFLAQITIFCGQNK